MSGRCFVENMADINCEAHEDSLPWTFIAATASSPLDRQYSDNVYIKLCAAFIPPAQSGTWWKVCSDVSSTTTPEPHSEPTKIPADEAKPAFHSSENNCPLLTHDAALYRSTFQGFSSSIKFFWYHFTYFLLPQKFTPYFIMQLYSNSKLQALLTQGQLRSV